MADDFQALTPAEEIAFNQQVIAEFRANGGAVNGPLAGLSLLLLTTTGARTGLPRTTPLAYIVAEGRYVFTASKGEHARTHPDWYHNLRAAPEATVEVGEERFRARAAFPEGGERQRLFDRYAAQAPAEFAGFLRNDHLEIPVVVLERVA
jgi:deazaflavin-dependent oxidoreductase (nitroreductase family)